MSKVRAFIGIDLSFRHTGIAVLTTEGEVKGLYEVGAPVTEDPFTACQSLFIHFENIAIDIHGKFNSDYRFVVEQPAPTGAQSGYANRCAGYAMGCLAPYLSLEAIIYDSREIKRFVGKKEITGNARKKLNILTAYELYPNAPWKMRKGLPQVSENHKADALLLAHIAKERYI